MPEVLALVRSHSPRLRTEAWDLQVAKTQVQQAGLRPNPELGVEIEDIGGTSPRSGFNGTETTVTISQQLELGGKRAKRLHLARAQQRIAQWDTQAGHREVLAAAAQAFIEVLACQERVSLCREALDLAEQLGQAVDQRVQAGQDSPIETTKAAVVIANGRMELEKARLRLDLARGQLCLFWGDEQPSFNVAKGRLDALVTPPDWTALTEAVPRHPAVCRWDDEVLARQAELDLARAGAYPDIAVVAGLKRLAEEDEDTAVVGVAIPLHVFDRNQVAKARAMNELGKARDRRSQARAEILAALMDVHARLLTAIHHATGLRDSVLPNAQSAFDAMMAGYGQGKFNVLEVLDSRRTLFEVKRLYLDALTDFHLAKADLESLTGYPLDHVPAGYTYPSIPSKENAHEK